MGRLTITTNLHCWNESQRLKTTTILIYMVLIIGALFRICEGARNSGDKPDRECNSIGNQLKSKGFSYPWWDPKIISQSPSSTPSGCPASGKSLKCCAPSFDTAIERRQMTGAFSQKWLGSKLNFVSDIFKEKKKRFDTTFKNLLQRAHTSFHAMFERTYGMLYIQHAHVFHALFTTLEKYYDDGRDPLEAKLNEFFAILTRKMFEVLNAQYDFTESYLSCATIVIAEKQGNDLHRQIVSSLRRSFVATRALSQALQDADRVVHNMQKVELNPSECLVPLSQMLHCPICSEQRAYKPCLKLCTGVTSKCLSGTAAIVKPWSEFTKAVEDIIDRLLGPYNVEAVVEPIHIKISEAIMNFQESGTDLSMAVFSKCGKPTLKSRTRKRREASPPIAEASTSGRNSNNNGKDDDSNNKSLEKLLRETKSKIRKAKDIWAALPRQVCNAISKDYSSQMCWNGTAVLKSNKTKGNREEDDHTDVSSLGRPGGSPSSVVLEQILIIQLITDKLKTAYNGGDVQWVKEEDDDDEIGSGMGSGSGESPTDLEDTDDDDPAGMITHTNTNNHPVITPEWKPNPPTNINPILPIGKDNKNNRPTFPGSLPDSGSLPPTHPDSDDEEDDIDEDEDEEDDHSSNLNIDSTNRNNNNRANTNSNSELDFGGSFTPPSPPRIPVPAPPYPYPTTTTTTTIPTTTRRTTTTTATTTTTNVPLRPGTKGTSSKTPAPGSLDDTAGKTVAVVKLFTPVIASMLQKLFTFN